MWCRSNSRFSGRGRTSWQHTLAHPQPTRGRNTALGIQQPQQPCSILSWDEHTRTCRLAGMCKLQTITFSNRRIGAKTAAKARKEEKGECFREEGLTLFLRGIRRRRRPIHNTTVLAEIMPGVTTPGGSRRLIATWKWQKTLLLYAPQRATERVPARRSTNKEQRQPDRALSRGSALQ